MGDLATFRTALGAGDMVDVHRNMAIIYRYFGDLLYIAYETLNNAVETGYGVSEIYAMLFEVNLPIRNRNLGWLINEMRLIKTWRLPYEWGTLDVVVAINDSTESIFNITFLNSDYCEWIIAGFKTPSPESFEIGITNSMGW